jgi:hypothetical protein
LIKSLESSNTPGCQPVNGVTGGLTIGLSSPPPPPPHEDKARVIYKIKGQIKILIWLFIKLWLLIMAISFFELIFDMCSVLEKGV